MKLYILTQTDFAQPDVSQPGRWDSFSHIDTHKIEEFNVKRKIVICVILFCQSPVRNKNSQQTFQWLINLEIIENLICLLLRNKRVQSLRVQLLIFAIFSPKSKES